MQIIIVLVGLFHCRRHRRKGASVPNNINNASESGPVSQDSVILSHWEPEAATVISGL